MTKLIDGVRDRFISHLLEPRKFMFSQGQRSFTLRTGEVASLLSQFLTEELELFISKNLLEDIDFVREYLTVYLFNPIEEEEFLDHYDISHKELESSYHSVLRGFRELYAEEIY